MSSDLDVSIPVTIVPTTPLRLYTSVGWSGPIWWNKYGFLYLFFTCTIPTNHADDPHCFTQA